MIEVKKIADTMKEDFEELIAEKTIGICELKDELARAQDELRSIKSLKAIPKTTAPIHSKKMTHKLSLDLSGLLKPSNQSKSPSLLSPYNLMRTES